MMVPTPQTLRGNLKFVADNPNATFWEGYLYFLVNARVDTRVDARS